MIKMRFALAASIMFLPLAMSAQLNVEIPERHKTRNIVIADRSEHLIIKLKDGRLEARSFVNEEKILLSDIAATIYRQDYVYQGSFNRLEDLEGASFIPGDKGFRRIDATVQKTSNAESASVFYSNTRKTPIAFSGLSKNVHTRLSYTISHEDLHFLPIFTFVEDLPTLKSTYRVTVPKEVDIRFILKGDYIDRVVQTKEENKRTTTYTFIAADIPETEWYADAPNMLYYVPHVIPYVVSYNNGRNASESVRMFSTVADLNRYYYGFIKDINKEEDSYLSSLVGEITRNDQDAKEKARHIYEWVQQNLRYIAYEDSLGGFIPREAGTVCKRKFGDCKDMSSALIAMCRKAGIDAYYTWIGTRDKPYTYKDVPLPVADNHMICTIKIGDEWIFMDGTDNTVPFGTPTAFIQGKEALVNLGPEEFKIIEVPEMAAKDNVISDTTFIRITEGIIAGHINTRYHGYPSWQMIQYLNLYNEKEKKDEIKKVLSRGSNKFIQESAEMNVEPNKDMILNSKFTIKDYLQTLGDEYYLNLNLQRSFSDEWVDISKRTTPISFNYRNMKKQVVVFDIPDGYEVKYLPPSGKKSAEDAIAYDISYNVADKRVILVKEFSIPNMMISVSKFGEYNKIVESLKEHYKESIVLKAIKK